LIVAGVSVTIPVGGSTAAGNTITRSVATIAVAGSTVVVTAAIARAGRPVLLLLSRRLLSSNAACSN
jgi:hypothetical protein